MEFGSDVAGLLANVGVIAWVTRSVWRMGLACGLLALVVGITVRLLPKRDRTVYRRGASVLEGKWAQRRTRLRRGIGAPAVTLAGVRVPPLDETKHFKLIGTTGTGKSTAIRELLAGALARGDRAMITDPEGGYLSVFHASRRGDVILNPFDASSVRWSPFAELRESYDAEQLARALIPSTDDASGREWRGYARTFVAALIRSCHQLGCTQIEELWRLVAVAGPAELRVRLAGTAAHPFLEPENARMLGSIRSVASSATGALAHLKTHRSAFSVRNWVRSGSGVLFLPYCAGQIAASSSMIAAWMRLAIFEAMQPGATGQRLWFVVDELDALGAIDGLKDALVRLRKFDGRCVLGLQSIAQVSGTYGVAEAQTIVENCGNTLILRCSGSDQGGTAQFASRLIGEREVIRRHTSRSRESAMGPARMGSRHSVTLSEQRVLETAVLPAELEQLPDRCGYLRTSSSRHWLHVALPG